MKGLLFVFSLQWSAFQEVLLCSTIGLYIVGIIEVISEVQDSAKLGGLFVPPTLIIEYQPTQRALPLRGSLKAFMFDNTQ